MNLQGITGTGIGEVFLEPKVQESNGVNASFAPPDGGTDSTDGNSSGPRAKEGEQASEQPVELEQESRPPPEPPPTTGAEIPTQFLIGAGALLAIILWGAFKKK